MMTTKDWILLSVPILLNGFIIYIIQSYFMERIDKNAKIKESRYILIEEFQKELNKVYESCKDFSHTATRPSTLPLDTAWNDEMISVRLLHTYYKTHKDILPKYAETVEKMLNEALSVLTELIRIQVEFNGDFNSEAFVEGATHHNNLIKLLDEAMTNCGNDLKKRYPVK